MTHEAKRRRFVFQLRIPNDVRSHYGGRTLIRQSLGNIPREVAEAKGRALAAAYHAEFAKLRATVAGNQEGRVVRLPINEETAARLAATWQYNEVTQLAATLDAMRKAPADEWAKLTSATQAALANARDQLRRDDRGDFQKALDHLSHEHGFKLLGPSSVLGGIARFWNGARVDLLTRMLEVIDGSLSINALMPPEEDQLPLVKLWGTAAKVLPTHWAEGKKALNLPVNPKTRDKYTLLAGDCDNILAGRPVEDLTVADLEALMSYWRSRGNVASTIIGKLDQLHQLLRQLGTNPRIDACFDAVRPARVGKLKTKRLPFTREQVHALITAIRTDKSLSQDDLMLSYLLFLTGGRLEEVCQLTASDLMPTADGWQVRVAEGRHTGTAARLKNSASARRLTIPIGVLPDLDAWLQERFDAGVNLFPALTPNAYGQLSNAVGKRLNRVVRKVLGPDRRLVLLSSRPTVNRVMRRAGVDPRVRFRQLGHADVGVHDRCYDAAEHFDDDDLLPASRVIASWLAGCLDDEAAPGVETQVAGYDADLAELHPGMRNVGDQAVELEHATVEHDYSLATLPPVPIQSSGESGFPEHAGRSADDDIDRMVINGEVDETGCQTGHWLRPIMNPAAAERRARDFQ
ncbi:MAG: tyrosine-type recombinase/integrase [Sterolibacteriaceae bacterium MAG5]|nr:tyrosine-type recombinase/integrase [Candidatus Nitricoxidireducens bremensis]